MGLAMTLTNRDGWGVGRTRMMAFVALYPLQAACLLEFG